MTISILGEVIVGELMVVKMVRSGLIMNILEGRANKIWSHFM